MPMRTTTRRGVCKDWRHSLAVPALGRRHRLRRRRHESHAELIEAARKEGKAAGTIRRPAIAERVAKSFEAKYPGIAVRVERSGAERVFQRISQEYGSKIYAVDCVNSSDAAHFIAWKRDGLLSPFVPEDVALHYPPEHKDPDGHFATWRRPCVIAQHQGWEAQDRPRASPTCSTRSGPARSSRTHPDTAATSGPPLPMARATSAGILREADTQRSCRAVGRRPAHESLRSESVGHGRRRRVRHVKLKERARPSRSSIQRKARRSSPAVGVMKMRQPQCRAARPSTCPPNGQPLIVDWAGCARCKRRQGKAGRKPLREIS